MAMWFYIFSLVRSVPSSRHIARRRLIVILFSLQEPPAIVGPYAFTKHKQCLECFKVIANEESKATKATKQNEDKNSSLCKDCSYPLCPRCQDINTSRHATLECQIFQAVNHRWKGYEGQGQKDHDAGLMTPYVAIQAIRFFLLKGYYRMSYLNLGKGLSRHFLRLADVVTL